LETDRPPESPMAIDPVASWRIFIGLCVLLAGGSIAVFVFRPKPAPVPAEIAANPKLARGYEIYLERCASCHGATGRGDGPTARVLTGPPPGNLTDADWKHGDRPEQVERVIGEGVRDTAMPGWDQTLSREDVRAVTAYVYHLAGRHVP